MSITAYARELNDINIEIKRLNLRLKKLKNREKEVKEYISQYLKEKDQTGVKYQGKAIILESREERKPKKKKEREDDSIHVLRKWGINNPENLLKELLEARRGHTTPVNKVKLKNIKS